MSSTRRPPRCARLAPASRAATSISANWCRRRWPPALSTLVDDERELGATVIDMGGGTTGMAVFAEGQLLHTAQLPIGGVHVTNDLARLLSTPVAHAERLKTLYGNVAVQPGRRARDAAGAAGRRGGASDRQGAAQHGGEHHPPAARRNLRDGEGTAGQFRPDARGRQPRGADRRRLPARRRARNGRRACSNKQVRLGRPHRAARLAGIRHPARPSPPPPACSPGPPAKAARCTTSIWTSSGPPDCIRRIVNFLKERV